MMINQRLVSQKHSQWPPESFRLSPGLRASAVLLLPWMSETFFNPVWPSKSFRLSPGLRACAASFLPWMSETFFPLINDIHKIESNDNIFHVYGFMMISCKACFSKHSQWPPESFRFSPGLRACAAFILGCLRPFIISL
ncbi:hypothetical protein Gohar_018414 [Gossypium harknessii]|uniref:Uncharacterized protein n=1 Tax=Gossypium harknessii TaxID=34285 RepID=A0A7J9G9P1_9ROSI|nr:hypothetical protein [Gossypium harknessii]